MAGEDRTVLDNTTYKPQQTQKNDWADYDTNPIQAGRRLYDTYDVLQGPLPSAGMGRVYRVRHTGWNMDMAMKQPHPRYFRSWEDRRLFRAECETVIDHGNHPRIVTCFYVRDIDGIPTMFSEWMEGGNLKALIESGALYLPQAATQSGAAPQLVNSTAAPLARVLKIALQVAGGLRYAHASPSTIIHGDVKPTNILLDKYGNAKIADFGLAVRAGNTQGGPARGQTPAYAAPEQRRGSEITTKTDVYGFGVTLLEMLLGKCPWLDKDVAGYGLDEYLHGDLPVPVPWRVAKLLRACLQEDANKRPANFAYIMEELLDTYEEAGCQPHEPGFIAAIQREDAPALETADILNNRALSYLDLNRPDEAAECWEEARGIDPANPASNYNWAVFHWRRGEIDDLRALAVVKNAYENNRGNEKAALLYAKLCAERCDFVKAAELLARLPGAEAARLRAYCTQQRQARRIIDTPIELHEVRVHENKGIVLSAMPTLRRDGVVSIWSLRDGRRLKRLDGSLRFNRALCISPDGKYAALGLDYKLTPDEEGAPALVDIVSLDTGRLVRRLKGKLGYLRGVGFSADSNYVYTVSTAGFTSPVLLKRWRVKSGRRVSSTQLDGLVGNVSLAFTPNYKELVTVCQNRVCCYELSTGRVTHWFAMRGERSCEIAISGDGKRCFLLDTDKYINIVHMFNLGTWDGHTPVHIVKDPDFREIAASYDGAYFCVRTDTKVQVWDMQRGTCVYTFGDVGNTTNEARSIQPARDCFLAGCQRGGVSGIWALPYPPQPAVSYGYHLSRAMGHDEQRAQAAEFARLQREARHCLDRGDAAGALTYLNQTKALPAFFYTDARIALNNEVGAYCRIKGLRAIHVRGGNGYRFPKYEAISQNRRFYSVRSFSGSVSTFVEIYMDDKEQYYRRVFIPQPKLGHMALSNDGQRFAALVLVKNNWMLVCWDLENPEATDLYTVPVPAAQTKEIFFSPNADALYYHNGESFGKLACGDEPRPIWETGDPRLVVRSLVLNRDGTRALVLFHTRHIYPSPPHGVLLIDTSTGETLKTVDNMPDQVESCAFLPDERFVLVEMTGDRLGCWNLETGECMLYLEDVWANRAYFPPGSQDAFNEDGSVLRFDYEYELPDENAGPQGETT